MSEKPEMTTLDFTVTENKIVWEVINDSIMGGSSQSQPEYIDNVGLCFSGNVSLENNGGFASIRSDDVSFDLSQYAGMKLRLRGDGKTYKFSLRTDLFFDGVSYQAEFNTEKDSWQEINLPFDAFIPTHHGLKLTTVAPMDISAIRSLGLFIAGKQEGTFKLEIAWIRGL
jgi:monofunctional biosynthetic peptidoglycan transglycosylase